MKTSFSRFSPRTLVLNVLFGSLLSLQVSAKLSNLRNYHLQKTKETLILSKKHLLSANSKSQDLTVKKLTRNNPTMQKKFNDLNNFEDEVA